MLRIGLTGGIGSGKSTVTRLFHELGAPIIDTDLIARQVVEPGSAPLAAIMEHFGNTVLDQTGQLDRRALGKLIFASPENKDWLESLLHPLIREQMVREIAAYHAPYIILDIPLLIETLPHPLVDRICVIDTPEPLQIARVMARDQRTEQEITRIIQLQAPRSSRLALADDIITNSSTLDDLKRQVIALDAKWRQNNP